MLLLPEDLLTVPKAIPLERTAALSMVRVSLIKRARKTLILTGANVRLI